MDDEKTACIQAVMDGLPGLKKSWTSLNMLHGANIQKEGIGSGRIRAITQGRWMYRFLRSIKLQGCRRRN